MTNRDIQIELALREEAQNDFLIFTKYTMPEFIINWHHRVVANKIQQFSNGEIKNLMIFLPPQTGKSLQSSRMFPAYELGKSPNKRIVFCAYNQTFSSTFNRDVQRIITSDRYRNVFPGTSLNEKNVVTDSKGQFIRNSEAFEIVNYKGFFKSTGIGGPLTGTSADIGIIDDPIKDKAEAESKVYRERLWDWYINVFKTRLHNDSQQLITLTRWHEDDLAGRILAQESEKWHVVVLPAINVNGVSENDPRQVGKALWPEKHSLERMLEIKYNSPNTFNSLYQQTPTDEEGNIIGRSDFEIVDFIDVPEGALATRLDITADTAYTKDSRNDPTGLMAFNAFNDKLYIYNWIPVRKEFSELCEYMIQYRDLHTKKASITWVEPKASGKSIVQYLKSKSDMNIVEYPMTDGDKESRLWAVEPFIKSKRVVLVRGSWNRPFIDQCAAFPNAPHDEAIDNLVMAINLGLVKQVFAPRAARKTSAGVV